MASTRNDKGVNPKNSKYNLFGFEIDHDLEEKNRQRNAEFLQDKKNKQLRTLWAYVFPYAGFDPINNTYKNKSMVIFNEDVSNYILPKNLHSEHILKTSTKIKSFFSIPTNTLEGSFSWESLVKLPYRWVMNPIKLLTEYPLLYIRVLNTDNNGKFNSIGSIANILYVSVRLFTSPAKSLKLFLKGQFIDTAKQCSIKDKLQSEKLGIEESQLIADRKSRRLTGLIAGGLAIAGGVVGGVGIAAALGVASVATAGVVPILLGVGGGVMLLALGIYSTPLLNRLIAPYVRQKVTSIRNSLDSAQNSITTSYQATKKIISKSTGKITGLFSGLSLGGLVGGGIGVLFAIGLTPVVGPLGWLAVPTGVALGSGVLGLAGTDLGHDLDLNEIRKENKSPIEKINHETTLKIKVFFKNNTTRTIWITDPNTIVKDDLSTQESFQKLKESWDKEGRKVSSFEVVKTTESAHLNALTLLNTVFGKSSSRESDNNISVKFEENGEEIGVSLDPCKFQ